MDNNKTLIVIAGPTASGKTAAGITIARRLHTDIISADSRQFFREMAIGTAKPTPAELAQAKHHFINSHSVTDNYNVGDFERDGLALLDDLFKTHDQVVMVGGSGLYIKAICEGFDAFPEVSPEVQQKVRAEYEEKGLSWLQEQLKAADPVYYNEVDLNNPQRLLRALEVFATSGQPFSSFRKAELRKRPFNILKIGLAWPREQLYERINQRVDLMIDEGLVDEARALLPYRHLNALQTVGYTEIFDYLDGHTDLPTAIELIKRNTRHFAKRQMTWFNRDKEMNWIAPTEVEAFVMDNIIRHPER